MQKAYPIQPVVWLFVLVALTPAAAETRSRWEKTIRNFEARDMRNPPPSGAVLFIGSSSIRMWKLDQSFPYIATLNRGFGGSQISDSLQYADRIILPYKPKAIVFYAGDNDVAAGKSPERVLRDFKALTAKVHETLPGTKIVFIAIKPSIRRWKLVARMREANALVRDCCGKHEMLAFVDIDAPMIGADGKPRPELFAKDGLHLSAKGYQLWNSLVAKHVGGPVEKNVNEMDFSDQLPRIPPTGPGDSLKSFQVRDGFKVELVAAEPLVMDPIAGAFDEAGRLFVVEMRGYSENAKERLGRVRLLTDNDGDGRFDSVTTYLDRLSWPTAVACYRGGILVGAAPDILYAKDSDGDGVADERRKVFTGFGRGNVQGLLNTFKWGIDNRIHGATSTSGGTVKAVGKDDAQAVRLHRRDFAINPLRMSLSPTTGGGQHGLSFDAWGRKFVCANSSHLQFVLIEDHYLARFAGARAPASRTSIAADGPQAEVFRASQVEPWRLVRTRLRVSGKVRGPVEGGGRPAGYFTGATGVTIYRGDAWPEEYHGNAFIGDVGSNLVHRKYLTPKGISFLGRRGEQAEFLSSTDNWFRPVQFLNTPDGTLYVLDMYREVIEHPKSLPPMIKKHLDLNSGRNRGRIYRIVPDDFERPKTRSLANWTTVGLVKFLEHPNGWHRQTAARLLYERQDATAVPVLEKLADESESPLGRMHALWSLGGLNALTEKTVLRRLKDKEPEVRENAARLADAFAQKSVPVRQALFGLTKDLNIRIRYQAVLSIASIRTEDVDTVIDAVLKAEKDPWLRFAAMCRGHGKPGEQIIREVSRAVDDPQKRAEKDKLVKAYLGSLNRSGNSEKGKQLFLKTCATCHRLAGTGKETGPNLVTALQRGQESFLLNLFDPNREVNPEFVSHIVATKDEKTFTGLVVEETAAGMALQQADGSTQYLKRSEILKIKSLGISLMPEGMEKQIKPQEMRDLMEFIKQQGTKGEKGSKTTTGESTKASRQSKASEEKIGADVLRISTFNVDATPPMGAPLCNGNVMPAEAVDDRLSARGIILFGKGKPIVLCAVDWVGIGNDGHLAWRQALATAAGTTADRVAVHTLHQHDAPACDFSTESLLASNGLSGTMFPVAFAKKTIERAAAAVALAIESPNAVTHVGIGQAKVRKVASNRRVLGKDGKVKHVRFSSCRNPAAINAPEGVIDPFIRVISLWDGGRPLAALSYYATHPQSYYGKGHVSADFVGLARASRETDLPGVTQIHFAGAGGNVAAGKYNSGAPENRPALARRLAEGMKEAWAATTKVPVDSDGCDWSSKELLMTISPHYLDTKAQLAILKNRKRSKRDRIRAARDAVWSERTLKGNGITITRLQLGPAQVLHMPGELFVEYQLAAQAMLPDAFVCMAAYGDYGPGYICTDIAYTQGGYESGPVSRVGPGVERQLMDAMRELLDVKAGK